MVLDEIAEALEKRRAELVSMLENRSGALQLERQHQIYGAINEISLVLQTLNYHGKNSGEKDMGPIHLVKPPEPKRNLLSRIFKGVKGGVARNR